MAWLAFDSFRRGGVLVDADRWYAGRDKVQHAVSGLVLARLLRHLLNWPRALAVVLMLAVLWEMWELLRFRRWTLQSMADQEAHRPYRDRPPFADLFSWRDIVATLAGAALAAL